MLPKLVNQDPELQRELQQTTSMLQPNQSMPNMSELMYNMFEGGSSSSTKKKPTQKATRGEQSSSQAGAAKKKI